MKYLCIIFLLISGLAIGQHGEKIHAYKTAYITKAMDLSPAEAEKFWPIYNQYEDRFNKLRKQERHEIFELVDGDLDALTESEAKALIEKIRALKTQEHEYHEAMMDDLLEILPAKKVLQLKQAEQSFKRNLLERYKKRRGGQYP